VPVNAAAAPSGDVAFEFRAMGTLCVIKTRGGVPHEVRAAVDAAIAEVQRIEAKYSRYRADSIVSRINASAGSGAAVEVDAETADLLSFAASMYEHSGGLFDITTGVLRQVWDFRAARLPQAGELQQVLARLGWQKVHWRRPFVSLPIAGMELDFGGFGKEYAADRAGTLLAERGVSALVNLGGDLRIAAPGAAADGAAWSLGIAHPRKAGEVVAGIEMTGGGLATSGDYERYFELDGQRYCHILDPHTGWPVQHWQSISVCAPSCLAAGALSTVAMLKGPQAHDFLHGQGVGFLSIDAAGQIHQRTL
jgi:thiamine biosynthesis lipoprotein